MGDSDSESVPSDIEGIAQNVVDSLLPEKSRQRHEQAYVKLEDWCKFACYYEFIIALVLL